MWRRGDCPECGKEWIVQYVEKGSVQNMEKSVVYRLGRRVEFTEYGEEWSVQNM
jgi:hypothetical protein